MFCDEHGTADYCGECAYGPEIERITAERDAAQAEARELREKATHYACELASLQRRYDKLSAATVAGDLLAALIDVENCHLLLGAILERLGGVASWEELWQHSERARVPYGKHKGELIADVPRDYKAWLMRQPDVDPYLMKALRGEVA